MNNGIDTFRYPKDVRVDEIILINSNGTSIDLYDMFNELNVYEDIYSPVVSADITITDSLNIPSNAELTGQEKVLFSFYTPGDETRITQLMNLYKISDRMFVNDKTQSYVLHLVSDDMYKNLFKSISHSFTGTHSDIIERILLEEDFLNTKKKFNKDASVYDFKCVIPAWTPFETIQWLTERSLGADSLEPDMLFFETVDGYNLKSIANLINYEPIVEYVYAPNINQDRAHMKNLPIDFYTIDTYTMKSSFDQLTAIRNGMFAGSLDIMDVATGAKTHHTFNYLENFKENAQRRMNPGPLIPESMNYDEQMISEEFNSHILTLTTINNLFTGVPDNMMYEKWALQRNSLMRQLKSNVLEIEVPGDSTRRVGDFVSVVIPSMQVFDGGVFEEDKLLSGRYLVTSIRHIIVDDRHTMVMELSKDSYKQKLDTLHTQE